MFSTPAATLGSDADGMIARAMNDLSVADRERALDEIHGITPSEMEEVNMSDLIEGLKLEIANTVQGPAYELALSQSKDYVEEVLLRFLRTDYKDISTSAKRVISHFELKLSLFGEDMLSRDITLLDLSELDMRVLQTGCMQLLPIQDKSGRPVLVFMKKLLEEYSDGSIENTNSIVSQPSFHIHSCSVSQIKLTRVHIFAGTCLLLFTSINPRR